MNPRYRCAGLLAALAVFTFGNDAVAAAEVRTITAVKQERGVALFKIKRVAPLRIKSAGTRVGRRYFRLALPKVRRGARRGVLRVRIQRTARRSRQAASSRRRMKPRLVLRLTESTSANRPGPTPVNATGPPASTAGPPASTAGPPATTAGPPPTTAGAVTRPVGSAPLSDAEAASRVRRSSFEPRPENAPYNARVPSSGDLAGYRAEPTSTPEVQYDKVTGNFTGTTDEIIQWAAHKWGLAEATLRAVATQESWWTQSYIGDAGHSPGLFQMRHDPAKLPVGHRLVRDYTAFNADLYGAFVRYYFDGSCSWCNDGALTPYQAGQEWMSIGAHFNPYPWGNAGQLGYIEKVKSHLANRTWAQAGF